MGGGVLDGVAGVDGGLQPAQGVVAGAVGFSGRAVGVEPVSAGDIAQGVAGEFDTVAGTIADGGQAVGGIKVVADLAAVGTGEAGELADVVVGVGGQESALARRRFM